MASCRARCWESWSRRPRRRGRGTTRRGRCRPRRPARSSADRRHATSTRAWASSRGIGRATCARPRAPSAGRSSTTRRTRRYSRRSRSSRGSPEGPRSSTRSRASREPPGAISVCSARRRAGRATTTSRGPSPGRRSGSHGHAGSSPPGTAPEATRRARSPSGRSRRSRAFTGEDGDDRAVVEVLVAGDALPFEAEVRRSMRRRAARLALDRLADVERWDRALPLALRRRPAGRRGGRAADPRRTAPVAGRRSSCPCASARSSGRRASPGRRLELRLEAAELQSGLGDVDGAVRTLRDSLRDSDGHEVTVEALAALLDGAARTAELRELLASQAELAQRAGHATRAADLWFRAAVVNEHAPPRPGTARRDTTRPSSRSNRARRRSTRSRGSRWLAPITLPRPSGSSSSSS